MVAGAMQYRIIEGGTVFQPISTFAALPALVRSDDELIILNDGLLPSPAVLHAVVTTDGPMRPVIIAIPEDDPLAANHPDDFERIDAHRHWAGVLVMRGGPVQQLADFPSDANAISLLLRLTLQDGTPCQEISGQGLEGADWLLAADQGVVKHAEQTLIGKAVDVPDWRAPTHAIAAILVRFLVLRGIVDGWRVTAGLAVAILLCAIGFAVVGYSAAGLLLAVLGAIAAQVSHKQGRSAARLAYDNEPAKKLAILAVTVDAMAALTLLFALAPWPEWQPLAALGPVVIGLVRLASPRAGSRILSLALDRAGLLLLFGIAAAIGLLAEVLACLALGLLSALLLRSGQD
ncbi:hypothetical protein [Erythrobacter sp. R86502]|uniref:hypothetical protein n=1 Tax=Erythrobacter sp. R86502 TaxID=3093846 RepID=UPI0036D3AC79